MKWESMNQVGDSFYSGNANTSRSHNKKRQYVSDHKFIVPSNLHPTLTCFAWDKIVLAACNTTVISNVCTALFIAILH